MAVAAVKRQQIDHRLGKTVGLPDLLTSPVYDKGLLQMRTGLNQDFVLVDGNELRNNLEEEGGEAAVYLHELGAAAF